MLSVTSNAKSTTHVLDELTYHDFPQRKPITNWGFDFGASSEDSIRRELRKAAQPLSIPERRNAPDPETMFIGNLINDLISTVDLVEKPKTAEAL